VARLSFDAASSLSRHIKGQTRKTSEYWVFFLLLFCASLPLASCKREQRQFEPPPPNPNPVISMSELRPGAQAPETPIKNPAEENAYSVSEGKRLYTSYNCSGCHFNGGGGIGPALMDEKWIYGSEPANVYATIVEGRPNGMPSFRHKISDYQVWEITAYVRSLSGQLSKAVSPGRNDDMNVHKSEQASEEKKPQASGVPKSAEQP
jgi:cytochrome c oxidase cbb3-type subunit 3